MNPNYKYLPALLFVFILSSFAISWWRSFKELMKEQKIDFTKENAGKYESGCANSVRIFFLILVIVGVVLKIML